LTVERHRSGDKLSVQACRGFFNHPSCALNNKSPAGNNNWTLLIANEWFVLVRVHFPLATSKIY
jgi:hypothetical protein